jgi:hypothetical protein
LCELDCQAGLTDCDDECVNLLTDARYCSDATDVCGTGCAAGETCNSGVCELDCQTGLTDCDDECVNLLTDVRYCSNTSTCGTGCAAGEVCDGSGVCGPTCGSGLTECSDGCVDTQYDPGNCGGCDVSGSHTCGVDYACVTGVCVYVAPVLFNFDDGTLQGWSVDGLWHVASHRSASAPNSVYYGDDTTMTFQTGSRTFGALTSPVLILSAAPSLEFDYFKKTEGGSTYDKLTVEISTDSGSTWTVLSTLPDFDTGFSFQQIDLAAYANQPVHIRFYFDSKDSVGNDYEGCYIDNVLLHR